MLFTWKSVDKILVFKKPEDRKTRIVTYIVKEDIMQMSFIESRAG